MIDWSKLKPYKGDKYRSFEELCYQIAKGLYRQMGQFTPIDDSGGGDGVEFFLTFPNGDQWGWQAKFYYPKERLGVSNRKKAIQDSLRRACQKHPRLKKWVLCTPMKFTPDEQSWFENVLPQSIPIPENMEVKLIHWADSDFNDWLSNPRFSGKRHNFFGELELTLDWFRTQVDKQIALIREKFNPLLHTETNVDAHIHALLGDEAFTLHFTERIAELDGQLEGYREAVNNLSSYSPRQIKWKNVKSKLLVNAESLQNALAGAIKKLQQARDFLSERHFEGVRHLDWPSMRVQIEQAYNTYKETELKFDTLKIAYNGRDKDRERVLREVEQIVHQPTWVASNLINDLRGALAQLDPINQPSLHILGDAGVGKTHIACHICHERLKAGLPALLVLGRRFTSDRPFEEQMRGLLDIPSTYSWNDFLQALAAVAEAYHTRIPLIIDGLNEATHKGVFSNVWQLGLPGLIQEMAQTKNVALITTCRTTYKEAIWPSNAPPNVKYAHGFDAYDVEKAIDKYFTEYKIEADLTEASLSQFEHPIYLKIFCESKNPTRQEEKHIYVGEQTLFEVFDDYLKQCNRAVCDRLGLHPMSPIIIPALNKMAEYLWQYRRHSIPLIELVKIVDGQSIEALNWQQSKTQAILGEGLLVCRDWYKEGEVVYFTYGLLGGYLIAQYLIQQAANDIKVFLNSEETIATLFSDDYRTLHPMHSDISRCLAVLLPVQTGEYLHDFSKNPIASSLSIRALFEIPPDSVSEACIDHLAHLFEHPQNRRPLLEFATSTVGHVNHPLNALFWSERLEALPMPERDISWTEHIRENAERFEKILARFEATCQSDEPLSERMETRLRLLAEYIMWMLTSTVRPLRDKSTRALYWYGRRFPKQFFDLVLSSLEINDHYVSERMLAATYGIAMARQYDFKDPSFSENTLSLYGRKLYDVMFKPHSPYATTHILARDYARRTIDIALIHHPDLLTVEERERITPPFIDGGIREWGECEDRNKGEYRDGNAPIHMDFENYTLGRLVKGRANYDFEHEEYKRVRANIFWRIYDLGYSLGTFGEIDKRIASRNWQYTQDQDGGKMDRYGKKYSWVAFYELAGFRQDKGLLDDWYSDVRISDADIDSSFPVKVQEYNLVSADFLGDRNIPVEEWILHGGIPDFESYLIVDELCGERGPWIPLEGYICQEDIKANRRRFIFLYGFIVKAEEAKQIVEKLKQLNLGARLLPEIPKDYYTYAGEIPWCDTYPANDWNEISFVVGTKTVSVSAEQPLLLRNGECISEDEAKEFLKSVARLIEKGNDKAIEAMLHEHSLELKVDTVDVKKQIEKYQMFKVLALVRKSNWEHYHSAIIPGRNIATPAKQIAEHLDLCSQPQTFDLFEKNSRRASITFRYGDDWHAVQKLTYLRQDLLNRFLGETNSKLIWAIWGEREFFSNDMSKRDAFAKKNAYYKFFQDIKAYRNIKKY